MLVEDEELLRQSLARHIDALGNSYKVVCQAMDGQEALETLKQMCIRDSLSRTT